MKGFEDAVVWIFLTTVCSTSCQVACPVPSEGCDCEDASIGYVECTGMRSLPRNLPVNVTSLDLDSNPLGSVLLVAQMKELRNLTLTQLFLSGTGLQAIEDRAFATQPHIRTLDLSGNYFARLDGQMFFNLTHLKNLFLTKSSIHEITSIVFTFTPALEHLNLDGNMLSRISDEFSPLSNLRTLLVSHNQVSRIFDVAFENQRYLERLDLSGNQLTTPQSQLFANLARNNGSLKLGGSGQGENHWLCCGQRAVDYRNFLDNFITSSSNSQDEYDIGCSFPTKFKQRRIGNINVSELESTLCNETVRPRVKPMESTQSDTFTQHQFEENTSAKTDHFARGNVTHNNTAFARNNGAGAAQPRRNVLSSLSDAHVALILIGIIVLVVLVTAAVVHRANIQARKRSFDDFVRNLPNSMEAGADEETSMTTKTYRHDAPVYGSTGNVVERHKNGVRFARDTVTLKKKTKTLGSAKPSPTPKRKPPPYEPPPTSPEEFDKAYEHAHFNNSSSAGLALPDYQSAYNTNYSNLGYESDASDDIWDANRGR